VSKRIECPKCGALSGDDWRQCNGTCPMPMSPFWKSVGELHSLAIGYVRGSGWVAGCSADRYLILIMRPANSRSGLMGRFAIVSEPER
jgi:hypothetical protein